MNGFITESTSKISDGVGGALRLLLIMAATTLAYIPIEEYFRSPGSLVYILILLAGGIYSLQRSLSSNQTEVKRATHGMTAGILLWQVVRFSSLSGSLGLFNQSGYLFWLMTALIAITLWKKVFPVGVRFFISLFLLNWIGKLYVSSSILLISWPPILVVSYTGVRYLAMLGILISLWFILLRSENALQRKYGALILYFCIMLSMVTF